MRFHLDEHVAHAIANGLRRRGIDVTTSTEAQLLSAPDTDQLAFAIAEVRVLVTHDADFLDVSMTGVDHPGIVYTPPGKNSIGEITKYLILMNDVVEEATLKGRVEFI
jgi:predicted nuclease of predicted toxin-antitoxin system